MVSNEETRLYRTSWAIKQKHVLHLGRGLSKFRSPEPMKKSGLASAHLKHLQWGRRTMGHRWILGAHGPVTSSDIQVHWDLSNYKVEKKTSKVNPLTSIYVQKRRWVNLHMCAHKHTFPSPQNIPVKNPTKNCKTTMNKNS